MSGTYCAMSIVEPMMDCCKHDAAKHHEYVAELGELGLWPINPGVWSLDFVIQKLGKLKGLKSSGKPKCNSCSCHATDVVAELIKDLTDLSNGLCICGNRAGHKKTEQYAYTAQD